MSWKFWGKKDKSLEIVIESSTVPTSTLFRWALYDLGVTNPNKFAEAAGFTPISEEGEELERKESDARLDAVYAYRSFISLMAGINGEILAETFTSLLSKHGLVESAEEIESEKELMAEIYEQLSISALVTAFSSALNLGIIINPGTFTEDMEYE
jgi:hypothetical protein